VGTDSSSGSVEFDTDETATRVQTDIPSDPNTPIERNRYIIDKFILTVYL